MRHVAQAGVVDRVVALGQQIAPALDQLFQAALALGLANALAAGVNNWRAAARDRAVLNVAHSTISRPKARHAAEA